MPKLPKFRKILKNPLKKKGFKLDLEEDPEDGHDYVLEFKPGQIPQHDRFDLRLYCTSIKQQGSTSSCVTFATVAAIEFMCKKYITEHPEANNHQAWFEDDFLSELFLYYFARTNPKELGGLDKPETYSGGMWPRNALQTLRVVGCAPEKLWPFDSRKIRYMPNEEAYNSAEEYQIRGYAKLPMSVNYDTQLVQMKMVIESGFPVIGGFYVPTNYGNYRKDGIFRNTSNYNGGHAVLFVGFDDNMEAYGEKGYFIIKNSWGTNWGNNGYCYVPYAYLYKGWMPYNRWIVFSSEVGDIDGKPGEETITMEVDSNAAFTVQASGSTVIQRPPFDYEKYKNSHKKKEPNTNFFYRIFPCLKK